jgi:hypothetical protein
MPMPKVSIPKRAGTVFSIRPSPTFLPLMKIVPVPPLPSPPPTYAKSKRTVDLPAGTSSLEVMR